VPKTQVQAATGLGLFDRVAVRSFVPETFMRQFENFLKAPGVLSKVSAAIPGFRSQTISAVEQVFGMMMGTEVSILDAPPPAPPDGVSVAVPISLDDQRTDVVVAAVVSHATGLALASRMLQSAEADLPDDAASSALAEILNMVGGRVQHGLTSNGLRAHIGLPAVGGAVTLSPESIVLGFGFEALDGAIREFSFSVSEQESSEKNNG
jgi:CheY-specific phosphatase CheX